MRYLAVLTVRNEGAFLLEWIAHHIATGFTDFLVFSNDCDDGTDAILDRLEHLGVVTHVRNPGPYDSRGIQFSALKMADRHPLVASADWILPLDIDEFVNIHVGDRSLGALLDRLPDATAITLTWRLFGNAGVVRYDDTPVLDGFVRAAPEILHWPWRAAMFKTLFRNDGTYRKLGVHRPRSPDEARLATSRWFDGSGRELHEKFRDKRVFSDFGQPNYALVQLNHYPLGAMESFVVKADRGRAVHSNQPLGLDYWIDRNFDQETDTTIGELRAARERLRCEFLADPELAKLHANAVAWRQKRLEFLLLQEPYRALLGRLMMAPPSRQLSRTEAARLQQYGRRALHGEKPE